MQPLDLAASVDDLGQTVQGIAHNPIDTLYSRCDQRFDEDFAHGL